MLSDPDRLRLCADLLDRDREGNLIPVILDLVELNQRLLIEARSNSGLVTNREELPIEDQQESAVDTPEEDT